VVLQSATPVWKGTAFGLQLTALGGFSALFRARVRRSPRRKRT
jgi:hypothetical protein